ncbi:MAG: hypothetical protein O7D91_08425 [Planctomycetota bacterium]|nr:hypothetical protein [Planctomycetota bacterium]
MSSNNSFELVFADGPAASTNGKAGIKRRIVLRLDGKDADVVTVRLDSDQSRERQIRRWTKAFKLDEDVLAQKLRKAAVVATREAQQAKPPSEVRGAESPPPTPCTLDEARSAFDKWLKNTDPDLLDVVFGTIAAHELDGDPVWMFIIGAPGDGKTEVLRALGRHPKVYAISTLTPGSLISGFITDGPDPSLIPKLDGMVLVIKDFTAILEMPNEARSEIMGILRDAYDGECCKVFGTGETKSYRSRFGLIAAVTPVIDKYWAVNAQLGERFLRFRLPSKGRLSKVRRALKNTTLESAMRDELREAAMSVLAQELVVPQLDSGMEERLIALADFVALARSNVSRDKKGTIQFIPLPEVGTRAGKALKRLAMGIAMVSGESVVSEDVYRIVRRVGVDTVPSMRARLLGVLWKFREHQEKTSTIANTAELPTDTTKVWLDDLRLLGMVERGGEPGTTSGYLWQLKAEFQKTIERSGVYNGGGTDSAPQASGAKNSDCDTEPANVGDREVFVA